MDVVLVLLFVVVLLVSYLFLSRDKRLPPGPFTLPLIGSYPFLKQLQSRPPHVVYLEASKEYGNIFSFRIGQQMFVVLTGYETVYQALVKQADVFSDRPNFLPVMQEAYKEGRGNVLFYHIQSTLVISNSMGLSEILRDFRTSTYQICRVQKKKNSVNHI